LQHRHYDRKGVETIVAALLLVVILVAMTAIVYSWSLGLFGSILPTPTNGREILTVENEGFDSTSMNMTLYLRNTGTVPTTLVSYYVKDQNGNQYARASWSVPSTPPLALAKVYILINTACNTNCALTGSSFLFQSGNGYTITLATQRNNQFSFTVVR
jgi:hypothetical protein